MARLFVASASDEIQLAIDASSGTTFAPYTVMSIIRIVSSSSSRTILSAETSDGTIRSYFYVNGSGALELDNTTAGFSTSSLPVNSDDGWVIAGYTKASGSVAPRFHRCYMSSTTWSHSDGNNSPGSPSSPGVGGHWAIGFAPGEGMNGDIAAIAVYPTVLSDVQIETLMASYDNWVGLSPTMMVILDQASIATPLVDLINDADQTSISGTAVSVGSPPIAFNTVPGAPTMGTATAGNGEVTVAFTAPASNGGVAITDYTVSWATSSGGTYTDFDDEAPSTTLNRVVTGLTNGTPYWFKVRATNSIGTGADSSTSTATPLTAGQALLKTFPFWWDARQYSGSGNLLNRGTVASRDLTINGPVFSVDKFTFDGVNDYMTASHHASMDADSTDWFCGIIVKQLSPVTSDGFYIGKRASPGPYWDIASNGLGITGIKDEFRGSSTPAGEAGINPSGYLTPLKMMLGMKIIGINSTTAYANSTAGTTATTSRNGTIASSADLYIGTWNNVSNWQKFEFYGAFIARVALTAQNITDIVNDYIEPVSTVVSQTSFFAS